MSAGVLLLRGVSATAATDDDELAAAEHVVEAVIVVEAVFAAVFVTDAETVASL